MITLLTLIIYAIGVFVAFIHIQHWCNKRDYLDEGVCQVLNLFSIFSWFIYPLYAAGWIFFKLTDRWP
jgi:hypothetical protein